MRAVPVSVCPWAELGLGRVLLQGAPKVTPGAPAFPGAQFLPGQGWGQRPVGREGLLHAPASALPSLAPGWQRPSQDWVRLTLPELMVGRGCVSQRVPRATLGWAVGGGASVSTGAPVTTSVGPAPARPAGGEPSVSEVSGEGAGLGWPGGGPGCDPLSPSPPAPAACPAGFFGLDCRNACDCSAGVPCDAVNGTCLCPAGRRGPRCAQSA